MHKDLELVWVTQGKCQIEIEQEIFTLKENSLAIIFPHSIHSYYDSNDYKAHIMIIDPHYLSDYQPYLLNYSVINPSLEISQELGQALNLLKETIESEQDKQELLIKARFSLVFALIFHKIQLTKNQTVFESSLTHRALTYINNQYTQALSLQSIADALQCNVYTLSKIFSNQIGMSFPNYLAHLRISHAKKLLQSSSLSILDIAYESGFETQRSFNRQFYQQTQMTPREYRKKIND